MFFARNFGKYRAIVISVAMFIILDLGVLGLNFYISSQIASDAVNVNLAGRQRMLSQKSVKALLDYQNDLAQGASGADAYQEMLSSVALFDRTLQAFHSGGYTSDATGQEIFLAAVETPISIAVVEESLAIWKPIRRDFSRLERESNSGRPLLSHLVDIAKQNNLTLLKLMNDLTNDLESVAKQKSDTLRWIQASAITLAILNFFLILFHFIGQLRSSDAVAEFARKETQEILLTVREGLLLLDSNLIIGSQYSESVKAIFGDRDFAGMSFRSLLHNLVVGQDMTTTEEYIKLLLNEQVKENLIGSLNPLSDVEVSLPQANGGYAVKHLSFRFNRTIEDGKISHILVTVLDITETVALRQSLEAARNQQGLHTDALKKLAHLDSTTLSAFLSRTEQDLHAINDTLKDEAAEPQGYNAKLQNCLRIVHRVKGDAGALDLLQIATAAHHFEDQLQILQKTEGLQGSDFLPLTLSLNDFLQLIAELREISDLLQNLQPVQVVAESGAVTTEQIPLPLDEQPIMRLAKRIAQENDKAISVTFDAEEAAVLSAEQRILVQASVIQLVRNAVVHGVESAEVRLLAGKPPTGTIDVRVSLEADGLRVSVRDDGQGLNLKRLREQAEAKGLYSREVLDGFSRTRVMGLIFEPGFSTAAEANEHAGRGIGMDLVRTNVNKMKGRIRISNQPRRYCEISFLIPTSQLEDSLVAEAV
ncbi:type IV pili methyl-accepting chemotaxis transducer N-terminal domain-containing protein [Pontibacterium sp. N1Y112]|uniref:Chemotaxis protein CheA n=1 Tax=Pontibacterium sinense TaxID=2781979 RepID=A0A8J7FVL1_9GAMM|nr:ATP-binding protein [Pontibacterium sinense]MBE9398160.1 type IV pili methyl-accepting chemotaxis transducer N-terminal domain-containing protein [Pontibacterium sinense]